MPLKEITIIIPSSGGWYWWRLHTEAKWEIVMVKDRGNGFPLTVDRYGSDIPITFSGGQWGPEVDINTFPD